jgi:hypothetical protein
MKRIVLALFFWLSWSPATRTASAQSSELVLLESSELDAEDSQRLRELLDRPLRVARLAQPDADGVAHARTLGAAEVLVLDRARARVVLVRRAAPELLVRQSEPSGLVRSPYVLAFMAAELLALSEQLTRERAARFGLEQVLLRAGLDVQAGSGSATLTRPGLALAGHWSRAERRIGLMLGASAALLGRSDAGSALGEVRFSRTDLQAMIGPSLRHGRLLAVARAQLGVALEHAEYLGPGGSLRRHASYHAGAGLELHVRLLAHLGLCLEAGAAAALTRAEFRVLGSAVGGSASWFARGALSLEFLWPTR